MAVKVLIKRIVSGDAHGELALLLKRMRTLTTHQPGYISGETLRRVDNPEQSLVISTWQSVDDWKKWSKSAERKEVQDRIDELLGQATQYEVYAYD